MIEQQQPPAEAEQPAAAEDTVEVRALKHDQREWYHAGKQMREGDTARVSREQAIALVEQQLVELR